MKILITGGSGFIGTHLVGRLIYAGHHVTIFDKRDNVKFPELVIVGDVRDKDALTKAAAGNDVIYHLAAEHADNVRPTSLYYDVNVGGAENLIAAADTTGIKKIIFTSSVALYPLNAGQPDEDGRVAPFNEYGKSKLAAEQVFIRWIKEDNSRMLTTIRPCVIFGEDNRGNVYNLLSQIYNNRFVMVGKGTNKKSIGYVGNLVEFLLLCLNFGPDYHLFNYADKPDLSTNGLIEIAQSSFGRNENHKLHIPYAVGLIAGYGFDLLSFISRKKFPISSIRIKKFCADTTVSAQRVLDSGFKPPWSLEQALRRTIKSEFSVS
ncbi:MAG: NAD-dependent epimerase/dehydratase family protein [Sedimentisphaerales bacterium]|nr:NAD-dependent epimerase/dehydratase family protein [Sedimentisphaerales bacterium]